MTGQDAVATAEAFHQTLALDGVILTKVDGDARGGAALSVKEVVGRPIVFTSTGEKQGDFEQFYPDRMADRILGMGDVLTLIEKAEAHGRPGPGRGDPLPAPAGPVHPRGLPRADAAGQEDGTPVRAGGYDSRAPQGAPQRRDRRRHDGPDRGHHPLHDPRGAPEPLDHQRLPPASHRQRQRHVDHRGQRAARPVQAGAGLHAPDGGHAGPRRADGPAGRLGEQESPTGRRSGAGRSRPRAREQSSTWP